MGNIIVWISQRCLEQQLDDADVNFFQAVERGDLEAIKQCKDININDSYEEKYWSGYTALHIVTSDPRNSNRSRDAEICAYLLSEGADVNIIESRDMRTPLHNAARHHRHDLCEILINAGSCLNAKDNRGWTPIHWAAWAADRHTSNTVFEILIRGGADLNITENWYHRTPMHWAVQYERIDMCKLFIAAQADVDIEDSTDRTPLHHAVEKKYVDVDIIQLLIEAGADVNKEIEWGMTALHLAAKEGRRDICELLVNAGADVMKQTRHNMTPLLLAKLWTNTAVIEYLGNIEKEVSDAMSTFKRARVSDSTEADSGDDDDNDDDDDEEEEENDA